MSVHTDGSFEARMLSTFASRQLYIMPGTTCGRYGIDSLSALAMMYDPEAVYRGMQIRFLIWDDGGYWLNTRKIYSNSFIWPESEADTDLIKGSVALIKQILRSAGYSKKELLRLKFPS